MSTSLDLSTFITHSYFYTGEVLVFTSSPTGEVFLERSRSKITTDYFCGTRLTRFRLAPDCDELFKGCPLRAEVANMSLSVTVKSASSLPNVERFSKSDPMTVLTLQGA